MPQPAQLAEGEIVNGSYRVLAKVGAGGMGAVYKVEHIAMKRLCALKTFNSASDPETQQKIWQRFQQEAQTIARLSHKSIVQIYDFGLTADGTAFYVMDFIAGKTLLAVVKEQGQLETRKALAIFIEVADGLAYAHSRRLVHRDIKPSNIMLVDKPTDTKGCEVKIVDFGLAKTIERNTPAAGLKQTGSAPKADCQTLGSPPYMSPEQFQNNEVDHRSDIYSFGCTLFEALTGVPPFISESALVLSMKHTTEAPPSLKQASLGRDFPSELEMIQSRLLAKDPKERYQDMKVVGENLAAVLAQLNQSESPPNGPSQQNAGGTVQRRSDGNRSPCPAVVNDNQDVTVTPLAAERTARYFLFFTPVLLVLASIAVAVSIGLQVHNPSMPTKNTKQSWLPPQVKSGLPPEVKSGSQSELMPGVQPKLKPGVQTGLKPELPSGLQPAPVKEADELGHLAYESEKKGQNNKQPFSNIVIGPGGKKMRVFQFPRDVNLGRIVDKDIQNDPGFTAKGQVQFAANRRLRFMASSACCNSPSYFRRFRPDELYEIDINKNFDATSEVINYLDHLSGLEDLSLFDTEINDDCIPALNQLKGLKNLDLSDTNMTGVGLAQMKTLNQLKALRVNQLTNVGPLILALQKSEAIDTLHIDSTTLTRKDMERITTIKNLTGLAVSGTKIGLGGLEILSHCPKLDEIEIAGDGFQVTVIPFLKKFHSLKTVLLSCDFWSKEDMAQLRSSLPHVKLQIQEPFEDPDKPRNESGK